MEDHRIKSPSIVVNRAKSSQIVGNRVFRAKVPIGPSHARRSAVVNDNYFSPLGNFNRHSSPRHAFSSPRPCGLAAIPSF